MFFEGVLVCTLVAAVSAQQASLIITRPPVLSPGVTKMIKDGASLASSGLNNGVSAFKQAINNGNNMASMPGMNEMASMGGGFATAGADVSNMMGQTEIADGSGLVNANMNIASGLANAATGLASNGITFGANMAEKGVEERFKMGNNAVGSIGNIMGATADYINQASGKVSSKDSPVADQMSAKIQNSSNLQIDEFLEDSSNDDENTILQAQTVF